MSSATKITVYENDAPHEAHTNALPGHDLRWLPVLRRGLGYRTFCIVAHQNDAVVGRLPLAFVKTRLLGRYLVSLPYLNSVGVQSDDVQVAKQLVDHATDLADDLDARHLELRQEVTRDHPKLTHCRTDKVHMRLTLPNDVEQLWDGLKAKVRNQIRKAQKRDFEVRWGGMSSLDSFYQVFARNMRDLGTPVYGRKLFQAIIREFDGDAEFCTLHLDGKAVSSGMLVHGQVATEIPSASTLREFNSTNANMLLYWHVLKRSVERGQEVFDFGRSTLDSNTFRFKKQWGAEPRDAVWQYYVRSGDPTALRKENSKYHRAIALWKKLPLWLTKLIGPPIVRGIP